MAQPDPSYSHLSTLDERWLWGISSSSSIFILLTFIFPEPNHGSANFLFLKTLSLSVNPIQKFCWNLNSLNSLVISNNSFLIEDLVRLSCSSWFFGFTILISYHCEPFLGRICLLIRSNCSVRSAVFDSV